MNLTTRPNSDEKYKIKVSLIGFGRFGKTLYRLLKDDFDILVYETDKIVCSQNPQVSFSMDLAEIFDSDVVFYAIPINKFEQAIKVHKKYFKNNLLIDVLSVKTYPEKVFQKYLPSNVRALLTHPMFGPDSSKNGFQNLPLVLHNLTATPKEYSFWKEFFVVKGIIVREMSAAEHDHLAANSQGVTHLIGRILEDFNMQPTPIDTLGAKKLLEVKDQTCNDTWELFSNLQNYNPYTKNMRVKLGKAYQSVNSKLAPIVKSSEVLFGIQGGEGSFNHQALLKHLESQSYPNYKIRYLHTSEKVLSELSKGNITFGQFAIHNTLGGMVDESIKAMARYTFTITDQYANHIAHYLMKRKDASLDEVTTIMAHPQVFKQCATTLAQKYVTLAQKVGEGNLVDHAAVAKALSLNKLPKSVAVLGPKALSALYDLDVIEENLQDDKNNVTTFLLVK